MFVGRSKELKKLQKLYENDSFEFAVFYGRRRIGKTTLINEFIKDKKAVYYCLWKAPERKIWLDFQGRFYQTDMGLHLSFLILKAYWDILTSWL